MAVIAVALNWNSPGFANRVLEAGDVLLWRGGRACHVKNFLFHNGAVQIVHAITKGNLRQRQSQADPIGSEMIDVIEINSAHCEVAQLLNCGRALDMCKHGRLRLERKWYGTAQAAGL